MYGWYLPGPVVDGNPEDGANPLIWPGNDEAGPPKFDPWLGPLNEEPGWLPPNEGDPPNGEDPGWLFDPIDCGPLGKIGLLNCAAPTSGEPGAPEYEPGPLPPGEPDPG